MKMAIGSDHAGFQTKEKIKELLKKQNVDVVDFGTGNEESVDYPDYAEKVALAVAGGKAARGILICGTGIGMSIAANKVSGIRAALVHNVFEAKMSREHNDANILVLGARTLKPEEIQEIVKTWLATPFEGGRHERRIDKIKKIEKENGNA
jgi:ribose 5-phosphate isomerase B